MAKKRPSDPPNPFDPARPAKETFVGRRDLLEELVCGLCDGRSYELTGPTGVGKTSLLLEIERRIASASDCAGASPTPLPVYVECRRQHNSESSLFAQIINALEGTLGHRCQCECPASARGKAVAAAEAGRLRDALALAARWVFQETKRDFRVVLLMDALHRITEKGVLQSLLGALNNEVDRKSVNVLLAGRHSIACCVPESVSDLRHLLAGHRVVGSLSEAETEALLGAAKRLGVRVDAGAASQVLRMTAGHPYRLQYYLHAAVAQLGHVTVARLRGLHTQATIEQLNSLLVETGGELAGTPPAIFVSYSRRDEADKNQLMTHLGVLEHAHRATAWCDDNIGAGADWESEIYGAIARAKAAVLLISANSLTSKFILEQELPRILARARSGGLVVVPIIARPCAWKEHTWLAQMNVRPKNSLSVWQTDAAHADVELTEIVYEIAKLLPP